MTMTTHAAHKLVVAPRRHLRRGESHADTSTEEEERDQEINGDKTLWRAASLTTTSKRDFQSCFHVSIQSKRMSICISIQRINRTKNKIWNNGISRMGFARHLLFLLWRNLMKLTRCFCSHGLPAMTALWNWSLLAPARTGGPTSGQLGPGWAGPLFTGARVPGPCRVARRLCGVWPQPHKPSSCCVTVISRTCHVSHVWTRVFWFIGDLTRYLDI